jgi:hypothetical protein
VAGKALLLDGDPRIGKQLPDWLRLGDVRGREPYDYGPSMSNWDDYYRRSGGAHLLDTVDAEPA